MIVECGEWSVELEMRERVIRGLEDEITRTEIADLEWLDCVEVALLRDALELLKAQEANDAIPLKWMREKCKLYCSFGDYNKAAWIKDLVQWWQRETREAQTHAETPEAVE